MIHVSIKYYNIGADLLGRREELRAVAAGTTVRELVEALAAESTSFGNLALTSAGEISGHVRLFRNGQAVLDFDELLTDGDRVRLFPAIAG